MKTPRELLLQKHRDAEPKLDAIRAEVLKELQPQVQPASARSAVPFWLNQLWAQLILPSRRIWAGLAMLWLVVLALNVAAPDESSSNYAATVLPKNTPERQMALREQQQLRAELLNGTVSTQAKARAYTPRPSSKALPAIRFV